MICRTFYTATIMGLMLGSLHVMPVKAITFSGQNGAIVFSRSDMVWAMSGHGDHARVLRKNARSPVWSPDGRKIVLVTESWRGSQLYRMNSNGSSQKKLTEVRGYNEHSPMWSPDGLHIAFVRESNKQSALFIVRANGSTEINVTGWANNAGYASPSWSPDGNKLVYEKYTADQSNLFIKDLRSGEVKKLVELSDPIRSHVAWSPNGKKILYNDSNNEIYTIWPDGSGRTVISDGDSYNAAWSPDGTRIAFLEELDGEAISISEDDGSVIQLPIDKGDYQEVGPPVWSPDGTKLVFTMGYGVGKDRVDDIFSLNIEEANSLILLAHGESNELNWQARP